MRTVHAYRYSNRSRLPKLNDAARDGFTTTMIMMTSDRSLSPCLLVQGEMMECHFQVQVGLE
jgi:hypothetical protein